MKYRFGNKIRTVRKRRGYTLKEVAERAGVSESLVSQIERNRISPAIDTLLALANVLDIDVDFLFRDLKKERSVNLVRRDERHTLSRDGVLYERLSRIADEKEEHGIEAYYMEIAPGCRSGSDDYGHPGKELGTIIEGQGRFVIGTRSYDLEAGDSISYASDVPHNLENTGRDPLRAFWMITPPKNME